MKYFETNYRVNKPIARVFEYILDIMVLQKEVELFENAELTSDNVAYDQLGKKYIISIKRGDCMINTILTLVEFERPICYVLSYQYTTEYSDARVEQGCALLPWKTMSCIVSFKAEGNTTKVTTTMHAHGVNGIVNTLLTFFYGIINYFQQQKFNKKTATILNDKLA